VRRRPFRIVVALAGALALAGCIDLSEPEIEDRWTRLDIEQTNVLPGQAFTAGARESISVRAAITYRRIVTGFAVAELRGSSTLRPVDVFVHPDAERVRMATDIDLILANSVTLGRATRAVTGWDHLIQTIDFNFSGVALPDSTGTLAGLFLVCYLGSGDEIELADGSDSLVVTPFPSVPNQLLPVGMELTVVP
jgi:hypothetical protein